MSAAATTPSQKAPTRTVAARYEKSNIPRALREQVWVTYAGRAFEQKCLIQWCQNTMTVFDFHVGHNIPEAVGGATNLANLRPICSRCNLSMGSQYTIAQWNQLSPPVPAPPKSGWFSCCFGRSK
jgi:5-methylcytosine-specific restriction endonuclease McrA